jgi:hypothetical protein
MGPIPTLEELTVAFVPFSVLSRFAFIFVLGAGSKAVAVHQGTLVAVCNFAVTDQLITKTGCRLGKFL